MHATSYLIGAGCILLIWLLDGVFGLFGSRYVQGISVPIPPRPPFEMIVHIQSVSSLVLSRRAYINTRVRAAFMSREAARDSIRDRVLFSWKGLQWLQKQQDFVSCCGLAPHVIEAFLQRLLLPLPSLPAALSSPIATTPNGTAAAPATISIITPVLRKALLAGSGGGERGGVGVGRSLRFRCER